MRFLLFLGFGIIVVFFAMELWPSSPPPAPVTENTAPTLSAPILQSYSPREGKNTAPIVLVEFGDFLCPACKEFQPVLQEVLSRFPEKILHVWKDFPLPIHRGAIQAHIAGQCANEQGKFWEYHDRLFALTFPTDNDYTAIANNLGLDISRFTACQKDDRIQARIAESFQEGLLLGIDQTPYVFLNTRRLPGITNREEFIRIITEMLTTKP